MFCRSTSLIVAAVAGASVIEVFSGTADAGSLVWGIIGIAALLEALVLFAFGLRLRHRYLHHLWSRSLVPAVRKWSKERAPEHGSRMSRGPFLRKACYIGSGQLPMFM